jgi:predicted transcriptional regulator
MPMPLVATRVDESTFQTIRELACSQERTVGYFVRKAVEEFVERRSKENVSLSREMEERNENERVGEPDDGCQKNSR